MNHLKSAILVLCLAACGHQLVEFKAASGSGGTSSGTTSGSSGGATIDNSAPPIVTVVDPSNGATSVPLGQRLSAAFSVAMDCATVTGTSFTLTQGASVVPGTVSCSGTSATFTPKNPLVAATTYVATITTAATDTAGLALAADYHWTFTTLDTTAPLITSINPSNAATSVCPNVVIQASFDDAMDASTIDPSNFTLSSLASAIVGVVSYDSATHTASFTPSNPLGSSVEYVATITTGVKNANDIPLANAKVWRFTTGSTSCQAPVDLRSLSNFVAVAGAGLTNSNSSGTSTLNGDVGLSPSATCLGDGIPCTALDPVINGTFYANDPAGIAAAAKADLTNAYNDAAGRPPSPAAYGDLSGLTLAPGVYTSGSTMSLAVSADLVLDAQGDANAVWIFQIGSSLTVNDGASVLLVNGAKADNVYWAIFASSTIGGSVSFKGNVLAGASNSVGTDSVIEGRLLCRTGQITLLSDTVTLPAP